jgi:quinol monooxygenase YgiN
MSGVVELRQYTLKPGRRDELIALFEREFVESQEAEGIDFLGTFRDLDDPDRFVWLRGFPDMEARAKSLAAFYGGPIWKAHRNAANDTMIDSDNVLLLRPAWNGSGFAHGSQVSTGSSTRPGGIVTATICYFDESVPGEFIETFRAAIVPRLSGDFLGASVTEKRANTFPALPVREGENVFLWFSRSVDGAHAPHKSGVMKIETLRLQPTTRSKLR